MPTNSTVHENPKLLKCNGSIVSIGSIGSIGGISGPKSRCPQFYETVKKTTVSKPIIHITNLVPWEFFTFWNYQ
jgi:hypothetical protein